MSTVAVIGSITRDYCAIPLEPIRSGSSGSGRILQQTGGCGYNIARNLSLLGLDVQFVTAVGDDEDSFRMDEECLEHGLHTDYAVSVSGDRAPTRMFIAAPSGDHEIAVHDNHAIQALNANFFASGCIDMLNGADAVVLEGSLPSSGLEFLADYCTAPIYADPCDTEGARKMRPLLESFRLIKPDLKEAFVLTDSDKPKDALRILSEKGIERCFLSMGPNGIFAVKKDAPVIHVPCRPAFLSTPFGSGDAMTAALVWADLMGLSVQKAAQAAMLAASMTVSCPDTVCSDMSAAKLQSV